MQFILHFNNKPILKIVYEDNEWQWFEELYRKLGLQQATTNLGLGTGLVLNYYRERNEELKRYWLQMISDFNHSENRGYYSVEDNINSPFITLNGVNIAVFRIIPTDNTVSIPLQKFINVRELNNIMRTITSFLTTLRNLVCEAVVKIDMKA